MRSTNTDQSKKIAQILFNIGAVAFSRKYPFRFDSGILSPVYVDNRILISYPKEREIVLKALQLLIKKKAKPFDVVAGVATAGIPHAAWIAQELKLPMIFVRSRPKDHGKGNHVEGKLERGRGQSLLSYGHNNCSPSRQRKRIIKSKPSGHDFGMGQRSSKLGEENGL